MTPMTAAFGSTETVLAGIVGVILAVGLLVLICSQRPDPKMLFLLSLLKKLPRA